ncbi:MAG: hypothetical protein Q4G06_00185 [Clostridia bacterium]|nr:hypothetical protein [Clostridia bacterium]
MKQLIAALMALILSQTAPVRTDAALTTFSFNHGGMSVDQIYSYAVYEQDGCMLADFDLYCRYEIEGVELDAADVEALQALIDENDLWSWDGFQESNSYVLDGDSFGLSASFADGTKLSAWGSNAYPKGYSAGAQAICAYFGALMEKYEIDPERMEMAGSE